MHNLLKRETEEERRIRLKNNFEGHAAADANGEKVESGATAFNPTALNPKSFSFGSCDSFFRHLKRTKVKSPGGGGIGESPGPISLNYTDPLIIDLLLRPIFHPLMGVFGKLR